MPQTKVKQKRFPIQLPSTGKTCPLNVPMNQKYNITIPKRNTTTIGGVGPTGSYAACPPANKHFDHYTTNTDKSIHVGNPVNPKDTENVLNHIPAKVDTRDPDRTTEPPN